MENPQNTTDTKNKLSFLIKNSFMSEAEKDAWFRVIDQMNPDEVEKLISILEKEDKGRVVIKNKYQEKIKKIKDDFNQQWSQLLDNSKEKLDLASHKTIETSEKEELESLRKRLK